MAHLSLRFAQHADSTGNRFPVKTETFLRAVPPVTYPDLAGMAQAGLARTDFAQARARRGAQKSFRFDRESIWVESAC